MIAVADATPGSIAFNTAGYYKNVLLPPEQWRRWGDDPAQGMWVLRRWVFVQGMDSPGGDIGHIDLAWTFGFSDPRNHASRASRMFSTLRTLLEGSRTGVALDALMRTYRDTNDDLTSRYQRQRAAAARDLPDPEDPRQLGRLWMQRNDLRGYVLLGDPVARLGVKPQAAATREEPREPVVAPIAREPEVLAMATEVTSSSAEILAPPPAITRSGSDARERAVLALLHGDEAPRNIAMRSGVTVAELFVWLDRYREAGRSGLAE